MTGRDYLKIWYRVQIAATLVILLMMMIRNLELGRSIWLRLLWMVIVLAIGLGIEIWSAAPPIAQRLNCWLQAVVQPVVLTFAWGVITREIITLLHMPSRGVVSIMILYYFVMYAPFASVIGGQLTANWERFLFVIWMFWTVIYPYFNLPLDLINNPKLATLLTSGAVGAVGYFVLVTTLMRAWHLSWPGLKPHFSGDFNWWILLLMVVLFAIPVMLSALNIVHAHHPANLFNLTATAFEAGLGEETLFRFAILGILFAAWHNFKYRLPLALIVSSILFGIAHLANVILAGQGGMLTTYQSLEAILAGLFFAVVYVYTGQLWLVMLMHFLTDWLGFIESGSSHLTGSLTTNDWLSLLILALVVIGLTCWMMYGQRRHVMERHVERLTGEHQHFGFSIQY